MEIKRLTTVVITETVDDCVAFWTDRLGFKETMSVPATQPGETGKQFAAVTNGQHELMFQTLRSSDEDLPGAFGLAEPRSFMLYVDVPSLDGAIERMHDLEPAVSRRTTFYGSEEIGYRDPCGVLVVLAEFPEAANEDSG
ncbi:MAG: hypothetical protein QNJ14_19005 [Woeseiaceae bacterium]|nr:hypothetical protein [Woeseiaceae bacterium]